MKRFLSLFLSLIILMIPFVSFTGGVVISQAITVQAATKKASAKNIAKVAVPAKLSVKAKASNSLDVSFKKVSKANGYVIYYSTSKKFTKKTTQKVTVKVTKKLAKKKTISKRISKLKVNKNYYVRVKAYKVVKKKKIYSKYSSVKKTKVKTVNNKNVSEVTANNQISSDDLVSFNNMIDKTSWIWLSADNFNFENSTAKDVVDTYYIFSNAMGTELYNYFFNDVKRIENDPKGKFKYGCYRFSADNFDWILNNVFEVKPDRNAKYNLMYYSGDYCYYQIIEGGGGFDYYFKTNSVYDLGNGIYGIIIDMNIIPDVVGYERTDKAYYIVKLKNDNEIGKYWSIIQFSKNNRIFNTSNRIQ